MRFHCGFSFRLSSLKKFLIPIALGVLAYFGLGGLFGCIQVKAYENFNTNYTLNLPDFPINDTMYDDVTYKDFYDSIIALDSDYYNIVISIETDGYSIFTNLILVPKADDYVSLNIYGVNYDSLTFISLNQYRRYYFNWNSDLTSNSIYENFLSCYIDNIDCNRELSTGTEFAQTNYLQYYLYYGNEFNNDLSYTFNIGWYIYYSNVDVIYSPDDYDDESNFVKSIYIDDLLIPVEEPFPSYAYLNGLLPDNPDNPDNPESESIIDYIYWFTGDNLTEYDVLLNIYVLLFLYCISMIILKLLMIIKGVKW